MAEEHDIELGLATHEYNNKAALDNLIKQHGFSNIRGADYFGFNQDGEGGSDPLTGESYILHLYGRVSPATSTAWDSAPIGSDFLQIVVGVAGGPPTDSNMWLKKAAGWVNISA